MRTLIKISMIILAVIMITVSPLLAQAITESSPLSGWTPPPMAEWFGSIEQVYSILIVIGGYLSAKIPGLNQISNATYRVLAFALLTGAGFWYFGADILGLAINYFFSTSLYELILKPTVGRSAQTKDGK